MSDEQLRAFRVLINAESLFWITRKERVALLRVSQGTLRILSSMAWSYYSKRPNDPYLVNNVLLKIFYPQGRSI